MQQIALKISGYLFFLVGLVHLYRVIFKTVITINGHAIPLWTSMIGAAFAFLVSLFIFKTLEE